MTTATLPTSRRISRSIWAAGALAYDATLPPDWRGKGRPPADEGTAAITAGRQRALDAHAGFRDA